MALLVTRYLICIVLVAVRKFVNGKWKYQLQIA